MRGAAPEPASGPAVSLRGVRVAHGSRTVLDVPALDFEPGRVHGLIGPNGAGKSTLLKAVLGLLPATGEVSVHGHALARMPFRARARLLSYLAQDTALEVDFNGRELVRMARHARLRRFGSLGVDDERAVDDALRLTGADAWSRRPVTSTSGGERQLTMLARAIAQDAAVLLLDEPISALDLGHELDVLRLLRPWVDAAATSRTVLVVLHDLTLAARFCDRLTLVVDGRIHCQGTPEHVLTAHHLRPAYGVDVDVSTSRATGTLQVTPL
ncbi:ABC transporter ATP-binding protein [Tessaracoccus terricola]